ncbi:MFS transporter [Filimonas effusa]|uniref:MFS transporter n=1 Tax=Filimonas effusa TaxID=2508721 RepID=A0A4Q1D387_9BACT|nr:MFS transporter [Filimonas effusa]RXK82872.1 MFS transporter [Filimonas effusa]
MSKKYTLTSLVVWVAALGYFVDIFDLLLFGMIRTASLRDLGITSREEIERIGLMLDNWQMIGMLAGGIFWGILGDKKGRLSVLFGSILTYSVANISNGFVTEVYLYALLRFAAGFGLAGELGAGVTLVNELLDKEKRGIGTALVAGTGIMGAVVGGFVVKWVGDWRYCYFIGGGMGICLLLLRVGIMESGMFETMKTSEARKGSFKLIFSERKRMMKYIGVVLVAVPLWYIVQLYAKYSPELADAMGLQFSDEERKVIPINCIMLAYLGLTFGDFACGLISQWMRSRKKAIALFMTLSIITIVLFYMFAPQSMFVFYAGIGVMGFSVGYWAVFMSVAAESFGTNIRSTVTNTAPNLVRGTVVLINIAYEFLKYRLHYNSVVANITVGVVVFGIAIWALTRLEETFGKDLNYIEE